MKHIAIAGRVLGFAAILAASLGLPQHAAAAPPGALKALDTDNDGTVDLAEAKAAASRKPAPGVMPSGEVAAIPGIVPLIPPACAKAGE
jgi:hypothetical protein